MNIRNSLGVQACIEILKWLRPRILGSIVCVVVLLFFPIFIIQSFFVETSEELWVHRLFEYVEGDKGRNDH